MRGGSFGEDVDPTGANLPALKEGFLEALRSLEDRLAITPGPYFEEEFGVLRCRNARLAWRGRPAPLRTKRWVGRGWPQLGAA